MTSFSRIDFADIEQELTLRRVRIMQIVYSALVFSVMMLLIFFLFFFAMSPDLLIRGVRIGTQVEVLAAVIWAATGAAGIGGLIVYRMRTNPRQRLVAASGPLPDGGEQPAGPAGRFVAMVQQGVIGRAVLFAIPALISAVIALYWVFAGAMLGHPERLVHLVPAFAMLVFLGTTWPTRDRVLGVMRRRLAESA